jgi:hypothetical protein
MTFAAPIAEFWDMHLYYHKTATAAMRKSMRVVGYAFSRLPG